MGEQGREPARGLTRALPLLLALGCAPWTRLVKDLQSTKAGGRGVVWSGVIGHVHLTTDRGPGDPGPLIFAELIARGYARHVVSAEGRIAKDPLA